MINKAIFVRGEPFTTLMLDDEDLDIFNKRWHAAEKNKVPGSYFKIRRSSTITEKAVTGKRWVNIHNEIYEKHFGPIPPGMQVDHLDFNTANNQKSNFELKTAAANNSRKDPSKFWKRRNRKYKRKIIAQEITQNEVISTEIATEQVASST